MEKEAFIQRISDRLGRTLPLDPPMRPVVSLPNIFLAENTTSLVDRFTKEMELVGGKVVNVSSVDEAGIGLRQIIAGLGAERIVSWQRDLFDEWNIDWLWDELGAIPINADVPDHRSACLEAQIGITLADFAIAETGTLVLLASPGTARSVSLTPTVHIALLHSKDIVATAEDAFDAISEREIPSSINLITGPSRSADIENDLSIGVHGPAAVYVIVLGR